MPLVENAFDTDGEAANSFAGRVVDCVRDGSLDTRRAQHANSLDATRQVQIFFFNHRDIEVRHVGMDRDQVVGEAVADNVARQAVRRCSLMQRHADAADQAAYILALRQQRIEDVARGKGAAYSTHPMSVHLDYLTRVESFSHQVFARE